MLDGATAEVGFLSGVGAVEEEGGNAALGLDTRQDLVVDAVEEAGDRDKDRGLKDSHVIQEFQSVA